MLLFSSMPGFGLPDLWVLRVRNSAGLWLPVQGGFQVIVGYHKFGFLAGQGAGQGDYFGSDAHAPKFTKILFV